MGFRSLYKSNLSRRSGKVFERNNIRKGKKEEKNMPPKKKVGKPSLKRVTLKRKSGKVASITPLKEGLKDIQEKKEQVEEASQKVFEPPYNYNDNKIVLMVRDPYWLYTYWEINENKIREIKRELGENLGGASLILRIYNTSDWNFFDIKVGAHVGNWYINVGRPNTSYCVDIGYLTSDGIFMCSARSNVVTTPRDSMSEIIDEEWMIPDWEMMYALSGGFGFGKSSMEVKELFKKMQFPSSWLFSGSPVKKEGKRPFWLVANCELIVYGATEPTASVTVMGKKIKLRSDGTFSFRFLLPDGNYEIPIEAIRDDGGERRNITPIINRKTK